MRSYAVSCLLNGRSFEHVCNAWSAADAIAIARSVYGPKLLVFSARLA